MRRRTEREEEDANTHKQGKSPVLAGCGMCEPGPGGWEEEAEDEGEEEEKNEEEGEWEEWDANTHKQAKSLNNTKSECCLVSFCDSTLAGCLCVSLAIWWLGGGSRG